MQKAAIRDPGTVAVRLCAGHLSDGDEPRRSRVALVRPATARRSAAAMACMCRGRCAKRLRALGLPCARSIRPLPRWSRPARIAPKPGSTPIWPGLYLGSAMPRDTRIRWKSGRMALWRGVFSGYRWAARSLAKACFRAARDGSKLAMVWLVDRLRRAGFTLFDTQYLTPHLASLGGGRNSACALWRRAGRRAAQARRLHRSTTGHASGDLAADQPDIIARIVHRRQRRAVRDHPAVELFRG